MRLSARAAELHERRKVPLMLAESLLDWADAIDRGQAAGPRPEALRGRSAGTLAGRPAARLEQRVRQVTR